MNLITPGAHVKDRRREVTALSESTLLAALDFRNPLGDGDIAQSAQLAVTADGVGTAIEQWIGFSFQGEEAFENPPGTSSHWPVPSR